MTLPKLLPQRELLEDMQKRYGTQTNLVRANVYMTAREVEAYAGPRCEDLEPRCPVCEAWSQWDKSMQCPVLLEREEVLKLLGSDIPDDDGAVCPT